MKINGNKKVLSMVSNIVTSELSGWRDTLVSSASSWRGIRVTKAVSKAVSKIRYRGTCVKNIRSRLGQMAIPSFHVTRFDLLELRVELADFFLKMISCNNYIT
jgi:hypothetical protein